MCTSVLCPSLYTFILALSFCLFLLSHSGVLFLHFIFDFICLLLFACSLKRERKKGCGVGWLAR